MDAQSGLLDAVFDSTMALAVAAVVLLVGLIMRGRQEAKRKRSDPRVIALSACLGACRLNRRVAGPDKSKA